MLTSRCQCAKRPLPENRLSVFPPHKTVEGQREQPPVPEVCRQMAKPPPTLRAQGGVTKLAIDEFRLRIFSHLGVYLKLEAALG